MTMILGRTPTLDKKANAPYVPSCKALCVMLKHYHRECRFRHHPTEINVLLTFWIMTTLLIDGPSSRLLVDRLSQYDAIKLPI